MEFPIDVSRSSFIAGSDPAAVLDMERRPRTNTATSELLCGLDVVVLGGEDGGDVWPVRVLGEPENIETGQPLRLGGPRAAPFEAERRKGPTFRARLLELTAKNRPAARVA